MTLSKTFYCAAASITLLAGILYLILLVHATRFSEISIFFLISGLLQIFWAVPIIKRWGNNWYYAGILGTFISIAIYIDYPIYILNIAAEILQSVFIIICGIIIWKNRSKKDKDPQIKRQI